MGIRFLVGWLWSVEVGKWWRGVGDKVIIWYVLWTWQPADHLWCRLFLFSLISLLFLLLALLIGSPLPSHIEWSLSFLAHFIKVSSSLFIPTVQIKEAETLLSTLSPLYTYGLIGFCVHCSLRYLHYWNWIFYGRDVSITRKVNGCMIYMKGKIPLINKGEIPIYNYVKKRIIGNEEEDIIMRHGNACRVMRKTNR